MAASLGPLSYMIACFTASTLSYSPSSFLDTERPVHLVVLTLLCTSTCLFAIARRSGSRTPAASNQHGSYISIPLHETSDGQSKSVEDKERSRSQDLNSSVLLLLVLAATAALTLRIEFHRRILLGSECATRSSEVWLPLLLALYNALRFQQPLRLEDEEEDDPGSSAYHDFARSLRKSLLSSKYRYVPAGLLMSLGCHMVAGLWLTSQSSHICPRVSTDSFVIPRLQALCLGIDAFLAIAVIELSSRCRSSSFMLSTPFSWATVTSLSAAAWFSIAVFVFRTQPENQSWLLMNSGTPRKTAIFTLLYQAIVLSILCISTLYSVVHMGLLHTCLSLTALLSTIPGFKFLWSTHRPYPPISSTNLTWSFVFVCFAWSIYGRTRRAVRPSDAPSSTLRRFVAIILLLVLLYPGLMKTNTVYYHPVDLLMFDAQNKYLNYLTYAAQSKSLAEAVRTYQQRYQDNPPPGFDIWFEFATNRSVYVLDEFNQIYNDLLPFRAVPPAQLREQTWEIVSNPWNEISGITIRQGKASVQENVLPTHRWMLEGVVHIIDSFSQHLPDMDLAFNLNDESRIALTRDYRQELEDTALNNGFRGESSFSGNRGLGWKDISEEPITDTVFENWSFSNTFHEWAAQTCPKDSAARKNTAPFSKSQLCVQCAADHSLGQFLANWSIAADPCHQPDLANLHGFYLSPAAFKATHQLRPVFSQSKAPGFNDILYPSAWNYMDKIAYAPTDARTPDRPAFPDLPFAEKADIMFWRGATSEGVSAGLGAWRGMARQRVVHMANNLTDSQHDTVTLLLPDQHHANRYTYTTVPGSSLKALGLHSDVHIVNGIARCGGRDCDEQAAELGLVGPADFQSHWQYKYLIDLDGAGFSGRFLPFLQSRSLPFKAALFREWYDSRLIPWLHFVPIDLRLHGLWSTFAYFSGIHGVDAQGKAWDWRGHQREAELIAESGREWSRKVLRKEDMEVYFFRLLLEWGRLTDDRRDELGFVLGR